MKREEAKSQEILPAVGKAAALDNWSCQEGLGVDQNKKSRQAVLEQEVRHAIRFASLAPRVERPKGV